MSDLTITDTAVHVLDSDRPWAIVRAETDGGVTGFGEVPVRNHRTSEIERYGDQLVGEDPFATEALFGADGKYGASRHDIRTTTMAGGFDMACWDIKGKYLEVPVHELLGGKVRDEIRTYANGWGFDARTVVDRYHGGEANQDVLPEARTAWARAAEAVVDEGYSALKFSPFQWSDGPTTSQHELESGLAVVESVAEAVPDDVGLLVEGHCRHTVEKALTASRRLAAFDVGFFEEPVAPDIGALDRVARKSSVPVATGEGFASHHGFAELLSDTEVSVVQPDVGRAGGITELRKVAAMASSERVGFAPHNAAGPIMTHAAVHLDAVTPAFMIQETFETFYHPEWGDKLVDGLTIEDGFIEVPETPGLGVELDESVLTAHENPDALPR